MTQPGVCTFRGVGGALSKQLGQQAAHALAVRPQRHVGAVQLQRMQLQGWQEW